VAQAAPRGGALRGARGARAAHRAEGRGGGVGRGGVEDVEGEEAWADARDGQEHGLVPHGRQGPGAVHRLRVRRAAARAAVAEWRAACAATRGARRAREESAERCGDGAAARLRGALARRERGRPHARGGVGGDALGVKRLCLEQREHHPLEGGRVERALPPLPLFLRLPLQSRELQREHARRHVRRHRRQHLACRTARRRREVRQPPLEARRAVLRRRARHRVVVVVVVESHVRSWRPQARPHTLPCRGRVLRAARGARGQRPGPRRAARWRSQRRGEARTSATLAYRAGGSSARGGGGGGARSAARHAPGRGTSSRAR
jgi:hypothetical protein